MSIDDDFDWEIEAHDVDLLSRDVEDTLSRRISLARADTMTMGQVSGCLQDDIDYISTMCDISKVATGPYLDRLREGYQEIRAIVDAYNS